MPGQEARDGHEVSNIIPFRDRQSADLNSIADPVEDPTPTRPLLPPDVRQRLSVMSRRAKEAGECFREDRQGRIFPQVLVANQDASLSPRYPAHEYFAEQGISPEEIDKLFGRRGEWRFRTQDLDGIYTIPPETVKTELGKMLLPFNNVIDRVTDSLTPTGYNIHGPAHSDKVVEIAKKVLGIVPGTKVQKDSMQRNSVIAGIGHDLGSPFDRLEHGAVSANLLRYAVPSVVDDPESWKTIKTAILLHESDNLQAVVDSWGLDGDPKLKRLYQLLKPEGLAMIFADKAHVGIERVSDKILAGAIAEDVHAVVNVMGGYQTHGFDGDSFVLSFVYNPDIPDQVGRARHFIPGWKKRLENGEVTIPFEEWEKMFARIYTDRLVTAGLCSLALFPDIEDFKVRMLDSRNTTLQKDIKIARNTLNEDCDRLRARQNQLANKGVAKYRKGARG